MSHSDAVIANAATRQDVIKELIKGAEEAADFAELKSIVIDLCRVAYAAAEDGRSAQFD